MSPLTVPKMLTLKSSRLSLSLAAGSRAVGLCQHIFNIFLPGFVLAAPAALSLCCALEDGVGQRVVAGYMGIPGKRAVLDNVKEWVLFACIGGDCLPDMLP